MYETDNCMTICDRCGIEIPLDEANDGIGEYDGGTLCNDCYAVVVFEDEDNSPAPMNSRRVTA